ncbi:hypothetical protein [Spirosoma endophyticum]|uniref:Uncharacterized protein n=1 Tax=Spirosoma endophyticum TaxID=662367 RepID=A0A1I2HYX1_9BACT|nr:hypothetical protein [Spirosoma endophyticum]SFF33551.1 hypothetical protein SAMN05216167_14917 [Spirosoma endophyticum]
MLELPTIFDVLLSLTYIFFIVSLFVSGIWEFISTIIQDKRAKLLQHSLKYLLDDPRFADLIYGHPLIKGQIIRRKRQSLEIIFHWLLNREIDSNTNEVVIRPSYIAPSVFARVLLGLIQQNALEAASTSVPVPPLPQSNLQLVNQWVDQLKDSTLSLNPKALQELQAILMALMQDADATNGGVGKVIIAIEKWYSAYMERVSGYFKQYSQQGIRWVALALVIVFNIDALHLTTRLYQDPILRELTVGQAKEVVRVVGDSINLIVARRTIAEQAIRRQFKVDSTKRKDASADTIKKLIKQRDATLAFIGQKAKTTQDSLEQNRRILAAESLGIQQLPVGWGTLVKELNDPSTNKVWLLIKKLIGWVLMVSAVSFGAPFWFDLLVKLVNIRNVGKIPEEREKGRDSGK